MAKYSTGDGGGGESTSCELCGAANVDLSTATVAGARLDVCDDCAEHGDTEPTSSSDSGGDTDRKKKAAQNTARVYDAAKGNADHWEDGADYDDDQLPYLVSEYGNRLTEARQDAGFQTQELADELGVDEADILAVEQGRATQAGVGGSLIQALEERLEIELAESR